MDRRLLLPPEAVQAGSRAEGLSFLLTIPLSKDILI